VSRLGIEATVEEATAPGISSIELLAGDGYSVRVDRPSGGVATLRRGDEAERQLPLARRQLGDLLAEELRRMDPDYVYAEALSSATGVADLVDRPGDRTFVWRDPAWSA
jgi:glucose-6-phosphate dehydrogenase assembly protein OpcA